MLSLRASLREPPTDAVSRRAKCKCKWTPSSCHQTLEGRLIASGRKPLALKPEAVKAFGSEAPKAVKALGSEALGSEALGCG